MAMSKQTIRWIIAIIAVIVFVIAADLLQHIRHINK
jgi:hypothetical protein